jgi:hypothetical protein
MFRWWVILWGGAVFVWISLEDNGTLPVAILGTGSAILFALSRLLRNFGGRQLSPRAAWLGAPLVSGVTGAMAAVCTALLMFLKTAIHAHIFPDYPPAQILAMLERAPIWAVAGLLIGLGVMFAWWGLSEREPDGRSVS